MNINIYVNIYDLENTIISISIDLIILSLILSPFMLEQRKYCEVEERNIKN